MRRIKNHQLESPIGEVASIFLEMICRQRPHFSSNYLPRASMCLFVAFPVLPVFGEHQMIASDETVITPFHFDR